MNKLLLLTYTISLFYVFSLIVYLMGVEAYIIVITNMVLVIITIVILFNLKDEGGNDDR